VRGERGQTAPLLIALAAIVLLLVVVVIDASAAYLGHQQVDSIADGAALRGADLAAEGDDTYRHGVGSGPLSLATGKARAAVLDYLRETGAIRTHPGLRATVRIAGDRVVGGLTAPVALPLHLPGSPLRPVVRSVGSAEVRPDVGAATSARP